MYTKRSKTFKLKIFLILCQCFIFILKRNISILKTKMSLCECFHCENTSFKKDCANPRHGCHNFLGENYYDVKHHWYYTCLNSHSEDFCENIMQFCNNYEVHCYCGEPGHSSDSGLCDVCESILSFDESMTEEKKKKYSFLKKFVNIKNIISFMTKQKGSK